MTETFVPDVDTPLPLDDFLQKVEASGILPDLRASRYDQGDMAQIADWMAQLALDQTALRQVLVGGLEDFWSFQPENDFKPSTIMMHRGEGFSVRAVVWMPPGPLYPPEIFSYYETHDHNFDFFTVGCLGPGYRTRLYTYDYDSVEGVPGEVVPMTFVEETDLPPGKVMYYYGSHDIHTQYPAPSISASLNLLLSKTDHKRQIELTLEETAAGAQGRLIAGRIDRLAQERALFDTVAALRDPESVAILRDIASGHASPETRAVAWRALLDQSEDVEVDLAAADADSDLHVRAAVRQWREGGAG
ncbi:MAG: hypothetical protein AAF942_16380, partial [Pseudomonadota bacterium]